MASVESARSSASASSWQNVRVTGGQWVGALLVLVLHGLMLYATTLHRGGDDSSATATYVELVLITSPVAVDVPRLPNVRLPTKTTPFAGGGTAPEKNQARVKPPVESPGKSGTENVLDVTPADMSFPLQSVDAAGTDRKVDVEVLRGLARAYERGRVTSTQPFAERRTLDTYESAAAKAIKKAVRPDCRNRYAASELLAIVPLVIDAVRERGCKW